MMKNPKEANNLMKEMNKLLYKYHNKKLSDAWIITCLETAKMRIYFYNAEEKNQ